MKSYLVHANQLHGSISLPPSKSQSIRAIFFASLASGKSIINHYLDSPDITAMIVASRQFGALIQQQKKQLEITGFAGQPKTPYHMIDAGNSGQVLRFMTCLAGLQSHAVVITGDHSIRHYRSVKPLLEALPQLGVSCESLQRDGYAPLIIKGAFCHHHTIFTSPDSQPVSGLLMTLPFRSGKTVITVYESGELPWLDLTLSWLDRFGLPYENENYQRYTVRGDQKISSFNYTVPGDLSSLSFPLVAALLTQSKLTIHGVDLNEPQGDKKLITVLKQMGAKMTIDKAKQKMMVYPSGRLRGVEVNINDMIDVLPIFSVLACFSQGKTIIKGAKIAREKESDRIAAMTSELSKMGAVITPKTDGMIIHPKPLHAATVNSYDDHRIAMSLAVAGMGISGRTQINNIDCVKKSFPNFADKMVAIGANIEIIEKP